MDTAGGTGSQERKKISLLTDTEKTNYLFHLITNLGVVELIVMLFQSKLDYPTSKSFVLLYKQFMNSYVLSKIRPDAPKYYSENDISEQRRERSR